MGQNRQRHFDPVMLMAVLANQGYGYASLPQLIRIALVHRRNRKPRRDFGLSVKEAEALSRITKGIPGEMIVPAIINLPECAFVFNNSELLHRNCDHTAVYVVAEDDDVEPLLTCFTHFPVAIEAKINHSNSVFHPRQVRVTFVAETKFPANGQGNLWPVPDEIL